MRFSITANSSYMPIAITPMSGDSSQPQSVSDVVGADLARTGLFRLVNTAGVSPLPTEPSEVNFPDWTSRSAEALVIGKVEPVSDGRVEVRFRLFDVAKLEELPASGEARWMLETSLIRARNRVSDGLQDARVTIEETLRTLK